MNKKKNPKKKKKKKKKRRKALAIDLIFCFIFYLLSNQFQENMDCKIHSN